MHTLTTEAVTLLPFASLPAASRALFKQGMTSAGITSEESAGGGTASPNYYAVVTRATIFHPQGGGQPSDEGTMAPAVDAAEMVKPPRFQVLSARMDAVQPGHVLHFGYFEDESEAALSAFEPGTAVQQAINTDKRLLYSRLHTAGHVLGAAVRHLVEAEVEGFDELKASHFPDAASCEFRGRIDGVRWKDAIQTRVDEYIAGALPVEIDWWTAADFRQHGLARLLPATASGSAEVSPDYKWRIVRIVGAEVYPCGGTHVDSTEKCGSTRVTKISRSKGISRVSYALADTRSGA